MVIVMVIVLVIVMVIEIEIVISSSNGNNNSHTTIDTSINKDGGNGRINQTGFSTFSGTRSNNATTRITIGRVTQSITNDG